MFELVVVLAISFIVIAGLVYMLYEEFKPTPYEKGGR